VIEPSPHLLTIPFQQPTVSITKPMKASMKEDFDGRLFSAHLLYKRAVRQYGRNNPH
jgi:hypothetical protein|tara:strand:- start:2153 stop:2323 length:171 start_codon:yes stop_codon:yes gene_type:complete